MSDAPDATMIAPVTRCVADIKPREVAWLWHHRIPLGMLSEICGDPGEGKSHLTLAIATAVTLGARLPGDPEDIVGYKPGKVLLVAPEDNPEATIRPRLERMGANLSRVHLLDGFPGETAELDPLDLSSPSHRVQLRNLVDTLPADLVVIDPITAHLGSANEWKDSEVRSILAPLARIADETMAAFLFVRHLRKSDSSRAIYRAGGSIAFTASVRSSLLVGRPEGEERKRAVVRVKGNLSAEPEAVGFALDETGFGWTGGGDWVASDLLGGDVSREERSARAEAADFVTAALDKGPRAFSEVLDAATREGIAKRTLQRAADELGVEKDRTGFPASTIWSLPQSRRAVKAPLTPSGNGASGGDQTAQGVRQRSGTQSRRDPDLSREGATGEAGEREPWIGEALK